MGCILSANQFSSTHIFRVLVVDDEESIRFTFSEMLTHAGFKTDMAEDVNVAQDFLENHNFDVILTDVFMPGTNGIEFLKTIKDAFPDIQVIVVTGYPNVDTVSEALRYGAYDYLIKPVTQQVLIHVTQKACEAKKLREEQIQLIKENDLYRQNLEDLVYKRTQSLLESKTRYAMATKAAMVGVWDWDLETNSIYIDPNLKAMLGYDDHEIDNNLDVWTQYILPDDQHNVMQSLQNHFKGLTRQCEVAHRMLHRDGTTRWFLTRGTAVRDAEGNPYRMLGTDLDITEQKMAEADLKRRDAILEAARFSADTFLKSGAWEENVDEVLARLGRAAEVSRVYIFENTMAENGAIMGTQRYEWVATGIKPEINNPDLVGFAYRDSGFGRWEDALSKGQPIKGLVRDFPEAEQDVLTGQNILSIVAVPIFVEEQWWGFIGSDECLAERDWSLPEIEALKVVANTLGAALYNDKQRMDRMRLVTAIEQSKESIIISDPDGSIQYVNPAFEEITGYKEDEVIGKHDMGLLKNGDQSDQAYEEMVETVKKGETWQGSCFNRKKNGSIFEEEATVSSVKDADGKIINYVAIKRDVTEKKRFEAIAEASNLMKNIGYVFSGIRHEIGNPINSIKITLTVLNNNLQTFTGEKVQEFLKRSLDEVGRVEYLLTTLRNFNQFEQPEVQSVRIDTFMENFLSLVGDDFEKQGIHIETLSSAWSMKGLVDPRALQQVMLNLMTNSAHALSKTIHPCVSFDFEKEAGWIAIKVIDNGCGMTPEQKNDLFKPFITSKVGGTGLGLVIAKKMLSKMNCTIDIESKVDEGTTVKLSIPEG